MAKAKYIVLTLTLVFISVAAFGQNLNTVPEVTARIQDKLFHANVFKHGDVKVDYANGTATLSGMVDSAGVKMDAERAARKVDDVTEVVNDIRVDRDDVTSRQIIPEARRQILTYYAYSIFDWITLESRNNVLTVNGVVTQPYKKGDIGNFLAHIKGVTELENNLEVLPLSPYDDSLRIAVARAIYNDPYFLHYADQALPPIHIVVKNGDVTLEGVVANKLDRAKAQADAALAGTYFKLTNNLKVEKD